MGKAAKEGFLRIPNKVFDALLRQHLSGGQCRVVLWVIRQTLGWNRNTTSYTWYRVAGDLAMDRGGVVRAGHRLLQWGILCLDKGAIGLQENVSCWQCPPVGTLRRRPMTCISDDDPQRNAMPDVIAINDSYQRSRCQKASTSRRSKDSSKDNRKKKRKTDASENIARQKFRDGAFSEQRHPAGAAKPIPGKYDSVSQNR